MLSKSASVVVAAGLASLSYLSLTDDRKAAPIKLDDQAPIKLNDQARRLAMPTTKDEGTDERLAHLSLIPSPQLRDAASIWNAEQRSLHQTAQAEQVGRLAATDAEAQRRQAQLNAAQMAAQARSDNEAQRYQERFESYRTSANDSVQRLRAAGNAQADKVHGISETWRAENSAQFNATDQAHRDLIAQSQERRSDLILANQAAQLIAAILEHGEQQASEEDDPSRAVVPTDTNQPKAEQDLKAATPQHGATKAPKLPMRGPAGAQADMGWSPSGQEGVTTENIDKSIAVATVQDQKFAVDILIGRRSLTEDQKSELREKGVEYTTVYPAVEKAYGDEPVVIVTKVSEQEAALLLSSPEEINDYLLRHNNNDPLQASARIDQLSSTSQSVLSKNGELTLKSGAAIGGLAKDSYKIVKGALKVYPFVTTFLDAIDSHSAAIEHRKSEARISLLAHSLRKQGYTSSQLDLLMAGSDHNIIEARLLQAVGANQAVTR